MIFIMVYVIELILVIVFRNICGVLVKITVGYLFKLRITSEVYQA